MTALLVMIHRSIADRSGLPLWQLQQEEGKALAVAASNVLRHYDIAASQKMLDWGAAITCVAGVYLPRIAMTVDIKRSNHAKPVAQAA